MIAMVGAILFSFVILLSILLICGLPLGELTMGGLIPLWFSDKATRTVCIVMAAYLSLALPNFYKYDLEDIEMEMVNYGVVVDGRVSYIYF